MLILMKFHRLEPLIDHGVLATGTDPGTAAAGKGTYLPSITAISLTP